MPLALRNFVTGSLPQRQSGCTQILSNYERRPICDCVTADIEYLYACMSTAIQSTEPVGSAWGRSSLGSEKTSTVEPVTSLKHFRTCCILPETVLVFLFQKCHWRLFAKCWHNTIKSLFSGDDHRDKTHQWLVLSLRDAAPMQTNDHLSRVFSLAQRRYLGSLDQRGGCPIKATSPVRRVGSHERPACGGHPRDGPYCAKLGGRAQHPGEERGTYYAVSLSETVQFP